MHLVVWVVVVVVVRVKGKADKRHDGGFPSSSSLTLMFLVDHGLAITHGYTYTQTQPGQGGFRKVQNKREETVGAFKILLCVSYFTRLHFFSFPSAAARVCNSVLLHTLLLFTTRTK